MQTDEDNPELMVRNIFRHSKSVQGHHRGDCMAPVIGGACNFKSKENRLENFPLKSSLKENVKHMYSTVGNLVHM